MQPTTSRSRGGSRRGPGAPSPGGATRLRLVVDRELRRRVHSVGSVRRRAERRRRVAGQVAGDPEQPAREPEVEPVEVGHLLRGRPARPRRRCPRVRSPRRRGAGAQPHDQPPGVCSVELTPGVGVALLSAGYQLVVAHQHRLSRSPVPARDRPALCAATSVPRALLTGLAGRAAGCRGRPRVLAGCWRPPPLPGCRTRPARPSPGRAPASSGRARSAGRSRRPLSARRPRGPGSVPPVDADPAPRVAGAASSRCCGWPGTAGSLVLPFDQVPAAHAPPTVRPTTPAAASPTRRRLARRRAAPEGRDGRGRVGQPLYEDVIRLQRGTTSRAPTDPPLVSVIVSPVHSGTVIEVTSTGPGRCSWARRSVVARVAGGHPDVLVRPVPVLGVVACGWSFGLPPGPSRLVRCLSRVLEAFRVWPGRSPCWRLVWCPPSVASSAVSSVVSAPRARRSRRPRSVVVGGLARRCFSSSRWARASAARAWPSAACSLTSWPFLFTTAPFGSGVVGWSANAVPTCS